jgi:L-Ala-D/L-Glu epimerase
VKIEVRHVSIPMRYRFGHARAARAVADNIVVQVTLSDGTSGFGEAVPRQYVTG